MIFILISSCSRFCFDDIPLTSLIILFALLSVPFTYLAFLDYPLCLVLITICICFFNLSFLYLFFCLFLCLSSSWYFIYFGFPSPYCNFCLFSIFLMFLIRFFIVPTSPIALMSYIKTRIPISILPYLHAPCFTTSLSSIFYVSRSGSFILTSAPFNLYNIYKSFLYPNFASSIKHRHTHNLSKHLNAYAKNIYVICLSILFCSVIILDDDDHNIYMMHLVVGNFPFLSTTYDRAQTITLFMVKIPKVSNWHLLWTSTKFWIIPCSCKKCGCLLSFR